MSRALTITAFVLVGLVAVCLEYSARRGDEPRLPTLAEVFTTLMSNPMGRASAFAGWVWAGYHFFAR